MGTYDLSTSCINLLPSGVCQRNQPPKVWWYKRTRIALSSSPHAHHAISFSFSPFQHMQWQTYEYRSLTMRTFWSHLHASYPSSWRTGKRKQYCRRFAHFRTSCIAWAGTPMLYCFFIAFLLTREFYIVRTSWDFKWKRVKIAKEKHPLTSASMKARPVVRIVHEDSSRRLLLVSVSSTWLPSCQLF